MIVLRDFCHQCSRCWRNGRFVLRGAGLVIAGLLLLSACNNPKTETIVVTEVVVVEGEERVITRLVEQTIVPTPTTAAVPGNEPVELDISFDGQFPDIDPQKTDSANGLDLIENVFVGLTNFNHETNSIEPELALDWEVSRDGRTWTFYLRDDLFWVQPATSPPAEGELWEVEPVRQVVAADVVYAIQRACYRETDTPDAFILFLIEGCEQVNSLIAATPADLERIGIRALDDVTLEITLTKPASQFLTITSMWLFHPAPRERVEEWGDEWQTADNLITSGPFFLLPGTASGTRTLLQRNPLWPIARQGNVDIVNILYLNDEMYAYQLWQAKSLDVSPLPAEEQEEFMGRTPLKATLIPEQKLFYISYNFDSGVFREPEVRRAFGAAIDRERLAEELAGGRALAMRHLTPPGVVAAPSFDEVGMGYSPDYARQQMAESGFRSCRLMPPITFLVTSADVSLQRAELIRQMWIDELGCTEEQIVIEQVQFGTLLAYTRRDAGGNRPDVWELAWASAYPDSHNWISDLLHCTNSENRRNRPCSAVDDLIRDAAGTADANQRDSLFREIENIFFGGDGIEPLTPLYVPGDYLLVQTWLQYTPAIFGGEQYDTYVIDAELKRLEQSR